MNFTREPIIETIITPKDGCKLAVRNTKGVGQEEYLLDAVELVSFGASYFFRSVDRSKSFLLPTSDYEVIELKEARITLKHVVADKSVKIGGGRDAVFKVGKDSSEEEAKPSKKSKPAPSSEEEEKPQEKKKDGRRRPKRRRASRSSKDAEASAEKSEASPEQKEESSSSKENEKEQAPEAPKVDDREEREKQALRSLLLVPPDALISERLSVMKAQAEAEEGPKEPPPPPKKDHTDSQEVSAKDNDTSREEST